MIPKDVFTPITVGDRPKWHFYVDLVFKAKTNANAGGDILSKIFTGTGNLGGFRYLGKRGVVPPYLVLYSSGEHKDWRDDVLLSDGIYTYFGDNKESAREITKTSRGGNKILEEIFELSFSDDLEKRKRIPPIFVFRKEEGRDVRFLGLAVPGIKGIPANEWLRAEWRTNNKNERFVNYRASFSLLDTSSGCLAEKRHNGISFAWLTDIENGNAYNSAFAPYEWQKYIRKEDHAILVTHQEKGIKTKEEQLPSKRTEKQILQSIYDYFYGWDKGYSFEPFANRLVQLLDSNVVDIKTTSPYRDGGKDGIGLYKVFKGGLESVSVEFYVQAKCYNPTGNHSVGVKDMSRLIARIKNRQFGVMVTTSFIHSQAYQEVLDDGHPIVFVTGKTIVDTICSKFDIHSRTEMLAWLQKNYPKP